MALWLHQSIAPPPNRPGQQLILAASESRNGVITHRCR